MTLRSLVIDAVLKPKADAVLVSGGIDSSTVACLRPDLPRLTGWYQGEAFDERPWARLVGGEQHTVQITPDDFVRVFDDVARALGSLRCGPGAVGQYVVCEAAAVHGWGTLLSGEGGDELFGGYARQYIVAGLPPPDGYDNYRLPPGYPDTLAEALEFEWGNLGKLCAVDDAVASANGIRVVPPLLDPWLVAHAVRLPVEQRIAKRALKDAMAGIVPAEILNRTDKRGFPAPFVHWAQQEPVKSFVHDRIGYTPDPGKPWDRKWWYAMLDR